jgi:hypothetical protein
MSWQEVYDFLIDVHEAKLYRTDTFFDIRISRGRIGWVLVLP